MSDTSPSFTAATPPRVLWTVSTFIQVAVLAGITLGYLIAVVLFGSGVPHEIREQHYTVQATAWLSGRLDVPSNIGLPDLAVYLGKSFVMSGPLPSVLLLPFNWLSGKVLPQEWLGYLLTAVNFCLLWWIGFSFGFSWIDRWWVGCSYLFGSAYLYVSLAFISPYLLQVLATDGLLLAISAALEYQRHPARRWWWGWCGVGVAISGLCRFPLFLAAIPFSLMIIFSKSSIHRRRQLWWLFVPFLVGAVAAVLFNYLRFGAWLEAGYHYWNWQSRGGLPAHLFSLRNVPTNFYYAMLALPELVVRSGRWVFPYLKPDLWGTSLLVTSPVLFWLFFRRPQGRVASVCWLAVLTLAIPVLTYAGIGAKQIGFRYALDFLPFLYVLVLLGVKKTLPVAVNPVRKGDDFLRANFSTTENPKKQPSGLSNGVKALMLLGVVSNGWLVFAALHG